MADSTQEGSKSIIFDIAIHIFLAIVMGVVVAIVANYFVSFAQLAIQARNEFTGFSITIAGTERSLVPIIGMLLAACLVVIVRRVFGITKWSGRRTVFLLRNRAKNGSMSGWGSAQPSQL